MLLVINSMKQMITVRVFKVRDTKYQIMLSGEMGCYPCF